MFDLILARGWHATTSAIHSLLHASATMAKVEVELHPAVTGAIGFVAFASDSVVFCLRMRRWMETRVVLHRRRERSDATGCVPLDLRRRVG